MRKLQRRSNQAGFALIELLLIGVILAAFVFLWTPRFARMREKTHVTIDLANFRQILQGSALYNAENDDRMPHPTWGADLTGPDGWAYLTSKAGRDIPGAFANFPGSCAGRDVNSAQFTNQLAFFKKGQVTQYLPNVKTAWCPKDVATRGAGA
jgi:Tfp pilus assembly protein FimT